MLGRHISGTISADCVNTGSTHILDRYISAAEEANLLKDLINIRSEARILS